MHSLEPFQRPPWIVAHRGVSARFPENTLAAFDAAVDAGADALELDLQFSLDGEWLICHDRTLARYGHTGRTVPTMEADSLRALEMGRWFDPVFSGERMPKLDQVLERYGRVLPLCLEVKVRDDTEDRKEAMLAALLEDVATQPASQGLYVLSFDVDWLERLHVAAPSLPLIWNLRVTDRISESDLATRQWLWGIDLPIAPLAPEQVQMGHDLGRVVWCYTCNDPADVRRAAACGIDAIVTDDPEATRAILLEGP